MANEFIHIDPGSILTKAEYELITGHQFNSQATGDILYASTSTQLSRLGIGSNTNVLEITGGVPAWVATSGTGSVARVTSPTFVTPALGTPSALVGTNISGTASSLTAGTVTTNANLTGHVTSSGNAAVLGSFTSAQLATALTNETGSGLAVFGTSPTLTTPALGTPSALVATNASGTASSLTAGTVTTNANLTGVVTSSGNATAIADKALAIAKLADGTDGELITWNASGVIAAVAVGSADEVLTSNGSGAAPTFQAAAGGGIASVAADTTPQVGGSSGFDLQAQLLVGNGGSTGIAISANGEVTMAAQPSVLAYNSTAENNATGNGTVVTIDYDTEIFDQNADFASDTFTAPVTGRYLVAFQVSYVGLGTPYYFQTNIVSSNRTFYYNWKGDPGGTDNMFNKSIIIDMDSADTVHITGVITGEGSDVSDIEGGVSGETTLSVQLLA